MRYFFLKYTMYSCEKDAFLELKTFHSLLLPNKSSLTFTQPGGSGAMFTEFLRVRSHLIGLSYGGTCRLLSLSSPLERLYAGYDTVKMRICQQTDWLFAENMVKYRKPPPCKEE